MARPSPRPRPDGILSGLLLLGRFRADGFARFEASTQAFLAGLAPWIAFMLVAGLLLALQGHPLEAVTDVAVLGCWLLVPPVVTELVAGLFARRERWLRYATAAVWSEWLMLAAYAVALVLASLGVQAGLSPRAAQLLLVVLVTGYWIGLHIFLARAGLDLTPVRAVAVVVAVIAAEAVLFGVMHALGSTASRLIDV